MKKILTSLLLILSVMCIAVGVGSACKNKDKGDEPPQTQVSESTVTLQVGDTWLFKYSGDHYDYTFVSDNASVAVISEKGLVKGVAVGETNVHVKYQDDTLLTQKIVVTAYNYDAPVEQGGEDVYRFSLKQSEYSVFVGESKKVAVTVYKNGYQTSEKPTYTLSDSSIAELIEYDGGITIKGKKAGAVNLNVKIGKFSANYAVYVYKVGATFLKTPSITQLTDGKIKWSGVQDATSYLLSFDGGITFKTVTATEFDIDFDFNPFDIKLCAHSDSDDYIDSEKAEINPYSTVIINDGKEIKLFSDKTVSGKSNSLNRTAELNLKVAFGSVDYTIPSDAVSWEIESEVVSVDGNTASAIELGTATVKATAYGNSYTSTVQVGTPITDKADLDALAKGAVNGTPELWEEGRYYFLASDVEFSQNAEYHERYLMPIAAYIGIGDGYTSKEVWGIYGNLNPDSKHFNAVFDGNGYAIKNAVIPYGTGLVLDLSCTVGNNFIGVLGKNGALKNIEFSNLTFEAYDEIDEYMYDSNNNQMLDGSAWEDRTYTVEDEQVGYYVDGKLNVKAIVGNNGGDWYKANNSFRTGLVGYMQNATVENVKVDTIMKHNSRNNGNVNDPTANGVLVGCILNDLNGAKESVVNNCFVTTAYSNAYQVAMRATTQGHSMGALVGANYTNKQTTVSDCKVYTYASQTAIPVLVGELYSRVQGIGTCNFTDCFLYQDITTEFTGMTGNRLEWKEVKGADGYLISFDGGSTFTYTENTYYDVVEQDFDPFEIRLAVAPYSNSKILGSVSYSLDKGSKISWTAVDNVIEYRISLDGGIIYGITIDKEKTEYVLQNKVLRTNVSVINVFEKEVEVTIAENKASWQAVLACLGYEISVDGGENYTSLTSSVTTFELTKDTNAENVKVKAKYLSYNTNVCAEQGSKLVWDKVKDSFGYKISFDGFKFAEINGTSYTVEEQLPLSNTKIIAYANQTYQTVGVDNIITSLNGDGEQFVLLDDKTLSGKDNTFNTSKTPSLKIQLGNIDYSVDSSEIEWTSKDSSVVVVEDGTIKAVSAGKAKVTASFRGVSLDIEVTVGYAVQDKSDLDALALASKNNALELWGEDAYYVLTNDIEFSSEAEYHERYLMPIAPLNGVSSYSNQNVWGIYGNLNVNNLAFKGVIDGNGHSIKNAVIPYGTGLVLDLSCTVGNNFIGAIDGGQLKNIAFENLVFETYDTVDTFMYSVENNDMIDVQAWSQTEYFNDGVIDIQAIVGSNGGDWFRCNNGFRSGLVGYMYGGAKINNVYVQTVIVNNTRNNGNVNAPTSNGVLVGNVLNDATGVSTVSNCVVVASISIEYNVPAPNGGGMGALIGTSYTGKTSTLTNCYVITIAQATDKLKPVGADGFYADMNKTACGTLYENCAVYTSASEFESANANLKDVITIWDWQN